MIWTGVPHLAKWESAELRQLKQKLANVNCRCPVCEKTKTEKKTDLKKDYNLAVQTENLTVIENSCQCTDSTNGFDLSQSSNATYVFDRFDGLLPQFPYPYGPCRSCMMMSSLLLGQATNFSMHPTNFKDEEVEANIKTLMKDKSCACLITREDGTAVSRISSFANDCKLLTTYENDSDADESDLNETNRRETGVNITSTDFNFTRLKVNESPPIKNHVSGTKSTGSDSTDLKRKPKVMHDKSVKNKRHSGIRLKLVNSNSTAVHSRCNGTVTDEDIIDAKKRVRISKNNDRHSDSTDFDPKYNSMDEEFVFKQRNTPGTKKECSISTPVKSVKTTKPAKKDDEFLIKKAAPDTKCTNIDNFLNQIRQPLPTFSEFDLTSSYSDVTFSILT